MSIFYPASSFILAISSWFYEESHCFFERNNPRKVPIGWHQQALRNFAFGFADALVFQTEDARSYFLNRYKSVVLSFQIPLMVNCHHQLRGNEKRQSLQLVDCIRKRICL